MAQNKQKYFKMTNSWADCRTVFEMRKQSMASMEHGLQTSLTRYALSMKDKMVAGAFGHAMNYGRDSPLNSTVSYLDGQSEESNMRVCGRRGLTPNL